MPTFTLKLSDLIYEDFDFGLTPADYPIFDEAYRAGLNKKILEHYWNYEIGQETDSMFRFSLNRKMREIMPLYNQKYLSTQIEFDPLQTMDYTDFSDSESTQEDTALNTEESSGTTTSTTLGKSRSVSSTTPQVQLSADEDYASSAADVNSNSEVTGDSSGDSTTNLSHNGIGTGTMERTLKGSQGPASQLLMSYRATFLNIDMEIIQELESLFMQIWDNGDEFTNTSWSFRYAFGIL